MGPQNESDSVPAIHAGVDYRLNWIDTAALYGLGHSETVVARALNGRSPRPYVFTKCERVWDAPGTIGAMTKQRVANFAPRTDAGTFPISKNPSYLAISNWSNACEKSAIGMDALRAKSRSPGPCTIRRRMRSDGNLPHGKQTVKLCSVSESKLTAEQESHDKTSLRAFSPHRRKRLSTPASCRRAPSRDALGRRLANSVCRQMTRFIRVSSCWM